MTSLNDIDYFLLCPVCKERFEEDLRSPRVLPCLHTVCLKCIRSASKRDGTLCPVCGEKFDTKQGNVALFPLDSARNHILECTRGFDAEPYCDQCQSNGNKAERAYSRCNECNEFLCRQCVDAHQRTKLTKHHHVTSLDQLKNSPLEDFHKNQTCQKSGHEGQPFSYICTNKTCQEPICSLCVIGHHQQPEHNVRSINDVYKENKRQVEDCLLDVKHIKTNVDAAIEHLDDEIQNVHSQETTADKEIEACFSYCFEALKRRKNELKEKLAKESNRKQKHLDSQLDQLKKQRDCLDQACRFSEEQLRYNDAFEFLSIKNHITRRISSLRKHPVDVLPHVIADINFSHVNMGKEFAEQCQKMGELRSSLAYLPHTKIQVHDVIVGREQTALVIIFHDHQNRPVDEHGADIKAEILDSKNLRSSAIVQDCVVAEGCYKVQFRAPSAGTYRALAYLHGYLLRKEGYSFSAITGDELDASHITDRLASTELTPAYTSSTEIPNGYLEVERLELDALLTTPRDSEMSYISTIDDVNCPEFRMELLYLYPRNELSEDRKKLTNQRSRHKVVRSMHQAFHNFRGTIATRPMDNTGQQYFEVQVHYFVKRSLRQDLIFEIGLCRKSDVDRHYTIDGHEFAYAVCARKCHVCRTICMQAWNNGQRLFHRPTTKASPPGTTYKATYGFLLDTRLRQWIVVDAKNRRFLFKFKSLDLTVPLWPVFGVYNSDLCNTWLTLRTGKDINDVLLFPSDSSSRIQKET